MKGILDCSLCTSVSEVYRAALRVRTELDMEGLTGGILIVPPVLRDDMQFRISEDKFVGFRVRMTG